MSESPETCPNCGADVPARAKVCPQCGSDEQTGWSEEAQSSHLGLPDDSFNYEQFVEREFGKSRILPHGISYWWWLVALILAALFVWGYFGFLR